MRIPFYSGQFKRDVKLAQKRGKDLGKLKLVLDLLIEAQPLPKKYCDHPLRGNWKGWHDLHIEPDWLLIYKSDTTSVRFERPGSNSDLFE